MNDKLKSILNDMAFFEEYNKRIFPAKAYKNAVQTISELDFEVDDAEQVKGLHGIGDGIFKKIDSFLKTGTFPRYEEFKASPASKLKELATIKGIGMVTAKLLFSNGIETLAELREATKDMKVGERLLLKNGFVTYSNAMKIGLDYEAHTDKTRMPIEEHDKISSALLEFALEVPEVKCAAAAGSGRRYDGSAGYTVGDIDLIVGVSKTTDELLDKFASALDEVIMKGSTKISGIKDRRQVDIRIVPEDGFGALLLHATGPMSFNIYCRKIAIKNGWTLNEYGLFDTKTKECLCRDEKGILKMLGVGWVDPKDRKNYK